MNKKNYRFIYSFISTFFILSLFLINLCYANILADWKDSRAYRPSPVLFLHGFAEGNPESWTTESKADETLSQYYAKYYTSYSSDPTILSSTRYPYLEIINFGSSLIDRNSSIDTYKTGDRYVQSGQREAGDPGWSDKLNTAIETLRQYYENRDASSQKIILVAHSMGGLAAREYLKNYSYANQKVEKLIMIGTPNLGSILAAATAVSYNRNRRWGWHMFFSGWTSSFMIDTADKILESVSFIDMQGDAVWDMDPTSNGSGFIGNLNYRYPGAIDHFAIAGKHWLGFNLSDVIVSLNSQLGVGVLSLKDKSIINATHWTEPTISVAGDNPLFKFLDSTPPVFEITYPDPATITEIHETTIHIQGKVYKEYLPADSELIINVTREEDDYTLPPQTSLLKPSDLWIPNNLESPVAEFDEVINFPGKGTYKISCQVKNPAGLTSDIKDVWVKIIALEGTNIIVHCHNPEGKEIASIQGMSQNCVEIYNGDTLIGYSASNAETHNKPIPISVGTHTIKAKFNGIVKEEIVMVESEETTIITFTFERTEVIPVPPSVSCDFVRDYSGTLVINHPGWQEEKTLYDFYEWQPDAGGISGQCYIFASTIVLNYNVHQKAKRSGWFYEGEVNNVFDWYASEYSKGHWVYSVGIASTPTGFSIPSSTQFNKWYVQAIRPMGTGVGASYVGHKSICIIGDGYFEPFSNYGFNTLLANQIYDKIEVGGFSWSCGWAPCGEFGDIYKPFPQSGHSERIYHIICDLLDFKISSVPYDLLGTGV